LQCSIDHQLFLLLDWARSGSDPRPRGFAGGGNVALEKTMQQTYQRRSATNGPRRCVPVEGNLPIETSERQPARTTSAVGAPGSCDCAAPGGARRQLVL